MRHAGVVVVTFLLALLAAGPATAQKEGRVVVYAAREAELIEPLLRLFGGLTGIEVQVEHVKDGLVDRVVAEGENSPADLLLTSDLRQLFAAKRRGITQPVALEILTESLPPSFRDADRHWFALTKRARVLVVSKERVSEDSLTYEELSEPRWAGRICLSSGRHPYNAGLLASIIAHKGEGWAERWLRAMKDNLARKPEGGDREQIEGVLEGKCDVAIVNSNYVGMLLADQSEAAQKSAQQIKVIFPNAADRGSHISVTGMVLAKHSPNPDNATLLMDFLVSKPSQWIYPAQHHEYPVREDANVSAALAPLGPIKGDFVPLGLVAQLEQKALDLVERVKFDLGPGS